MRSYFDSSPLPWSISDYPPMNVNRNGRVVLDGERAAVAFHLKQSDAELICKAVNDSARPVADLSDAERLLRKIDGALFWARRCPQGENCLNCPRALFEAEEAAFDLRLILQALR